MPRSAGKQLEFLNIDVQSFSELTTRLLEQARFAREARSDLRETLLGRLAAVDARPSGGGAYASGHWGVPGPDRQLLRRPAR
jgi:hypothetical protein